MIVCLTQMYEFLVTSVNERESAINRVVIEPLQSTLDEFTKLKELLEKCIDVKSARQNDYKINPEFSSDLKEMSSGVEQLLLEMRKLVHEVQKDLGAAKKVDLVPSDQYTFVFELDKKEADAGFRKTKTKYRTLSVKQKITVFTSAELR